MTVYVPNQFKLQEPKPSTQYLGRGGKPIIDSALIKQMTKDDPKTLLAIESPDKRATMEIELIPITETLTRLMGDSIQYIETCKKMAIAAATQANDTFDTIFTKIKIDKIVFNEMFTVSTIHGHRDYDGGYVAKIGNYYLGVHIFFEKGKRGNDLKNIIETAKFQ